MAHFVVSDRCYDVIIDEFIRVRMRQQSEQRFFPLTWDRERSRRRSWTGRFSEVSGVSAHESARGLDTAIVSFEFRCQTISRTQKISCISRKKSQNAASRGGKLEPSFVCTCEQACRSCI